MDALTKRPQVYAMANHTVIETVSKLSELFKCFGFPEILVKDEGSQFNAKSFKRC